MILGIGIDTVDIKRMEKALGKGEPSPFEMRVFTENERAAAPEGLRRAAYFAARFAAKEAVFEAVAHLLPEKNFDLRIVETRHGENGFPYIYEEGPLGEILRKAGAAKLHLSVTTEADLATAFVIAEGKDA